MNLVVLVPESSPVIGLGRVKGRNTDDLFSKMKVLQINLSNVLMLELEILEFVKVVDYYPNVLIPYQILLTMSMTVASAEISFSKLKLLKFYLRSSMSQEILNGLSNFMY